MANMQRVSEALTEVVERIVGDAAKDLDFDELARQALDEYDFEDAFTNAVNLDNLASEAIEEAIREHDFSEELIKKVDVSKLLVDNCDFTAVADRLMDDSNFAAMIRREILKSEERAGAEIAFLRQEVQILRDQLAASREDLEVAASRQRQGGILAWLGLV